MTAEERARLQALHARMIAISQAADSATPPRPLTAEEAAELVTVQAEFDAITDRDKRRTALAARTACLAESTGRRSATARGGLSVGERSDPNGGFQNMAEFATSVRNACVPGGNVDPRLAAIRKASSAGGAVGENGIQAAPTGFATENSGADQGYLVPPEMRAGIWELVFQGEDLINMVTAEPTSSNHVEMLSDETTPWGALGIKAYWRSQAQQMTSTGKPHQDPRTVKLQELFAFVTAQGELLEDAPRLNSRLTTGAATAIRWTASEAIMRGTGAGQPLGWLNSPALVTISKEVGQAAASIVLNNLTKMYARLLYMGTGRARWIANRDTLPALMPLTLGQNGIFMLPNAGLAAAPQGAILGLPMAWNEHCNTLGTAGDIQLVDMDGYYLVQKAQGVQFDTSIHLFFDYNIEAFRWIFRLGGNPFLSAPVTPANGSATRSHFIALADRS